MTLAVWLSSWIDLRAASLAPRTVESYRSLLRLHVAPSLGFVVWRGLKPRLIAPFLSSLAASGRERTAQLCYALLRAAYRDAVKAGSIPRSPLDRVPYPRHLAAPPRFWSIAQLRRFVSAQADDQWRVAWVLALCCGLRRGELCGLRWLDVDLDAAQITVCNQRVALAGRGVIDCAPKSSSGMRRLPLPSVVCDLLSRHQLLQSADFALHKAPGCLYVLSGPTGVPISPICAQSPFYGRFTGR